MIRTVSQGKKIKLSLHKLICRRDSFITHRAFCDALAQETAKTQPSVTDEDDNAVKAGELPPPPPPQSSPQPPHTPSTSVLSPVLSIQSSGMLLHDNHLTSSTS